MSNKSKSKAKSNVCQLTKALDFLMRPDVEVLPNQIKLFGDKASNNMSYQHNRIFILNDPMSPRISPALAVEIGFIESVLLLQIEFWISIDSLVFEGRLWTTKSVLDFTQTFPFWSKRTIERALANLRTLKLIDSESLNRSVLNQTLSHSINFESIKKLTSIQLGAYVDSRYRQNGGIDTVKMADCTLKEYNNISLAGAPAHTRTREITSGGPSSDDPSSDQLEATEESLDTFWASQGDLVEQPVFGFQNPTPRSAHPPSLSKGVSDRSEQPRLPRVPASGAKKGSKAAKNAKAAASDMIPERVLTWFYQVCFFAEGSEALGLLTGNQRTQVRRVAKAMIDAGVSFHPADLIVFQNFWSKDWRGKGDRPPRPLQIQETWSEAMYYGRKKTKKVVVKPEGRKPSTLRDAMFQMRNQK